jgi:hypothetical protein
MCLCRRPMATLMLDAFSALRLSAFVAAFSAALLGLELALHRGPSKLSPLLTRGLGAAVLVVSIWGFVGGPGLAFAVLAVGLCAVALVYRGSYCGGADSVFFYACLALAMGVRWPQTAVAMLSVLAVLSYVVAGLAKAAQRRWWSGRALSEVIQNDFYAVPPAVKKLSHRLPLMRFASWAILLWELGFVGVFISRHFVGPFVVAGLVFHLAVFWAFGLNRFFWTWAITYPALFALHH